ncbi:MAG: hypothetical protein IT363_01375 [Methanoregulaceae archaeon]|nr:hypothetical protein [Methanoregulaceae archaeon]
MKRLWWLSLVVVFAIACEPKDRESIARDGGKALEHAGKAISTAWNSVAAKVREISPESSEEALSRARQAVVDVQEKAKAIPNPTPEVLAQLEAARAAIAKIDAAEKLRSLQEQAAALGADAKNKADRAADGAQDLRKQLEAGNERLKLLEQEIAAARESYDAAAKKLESLTTP